MINYAFHVIVHGHIKCWILAEVYILILPILLLKIHLYGIEHKYFDLCQFEDQSSEKYLWIYMSIYQKSS